MSPVLSDRSTLYELAGEALEIAAILEDNEGELTPELEQRLDWLMNLTPQRMEAAAIVTQRLEMSAQACEQEVERLAARAKSFHDNAQRLKDRMAVVLDVAFGGKVKTDKFTIWTQAAPDHVSFDVAPGHTIEEIEAADASLVRVRKELDKIQLKAKFKTGEALPPAIEFVSAPGKRYCRIK